MTTSESGSDRVLGSLRAEDGTGSVRVEDRLDAKLDDVWSALTDPARLARWYGQINGDLRAGGEFSLYIESDGWKGTGTVETCDPPHRLRVTTRESDASFESGQGVAPFDEVIEATLSSDGDDTVLVVEVRGLPLDKIAYYGVGWQIHVESLARYLAGGQRGDTEPRWDDLIPPYLELAAGLA